MRLSAALEYEKLRQEPSSWNKVIVHRDGKFYHIYDWSAWLVKTIACTEEFQQQRGDRKMLQANRYKGKEKEYVMLGFPVDSLSKYIPEYTAIDNMEDGDLAISIDFEPDVDYDTLQASFDEWKEQCQYVERKARSLKEATSGEGQANVIAHSGIFSILSKIFAYPVERTTPAENIEFISQLKQDVAALF